MITPHVLMKNGRCCYCNRRIRDPEEHCEARLQDAKNRSAIRGVTLEEYMGGRQ